MASQSGSTTIRDDYRCSICRQKGAFSCEHDTRYRDQYLDSFGQENQAQTSRHNRDNYNAENKIRMDDGPNHYPVQTSDYNARTNASKNRKTKTKTKKKACIIS